MGEPLRDTGALAWVSRGSWPLSPTLPRAPPGVCSRPCGLSPTREPTAGLRTVPGASRLSPRGMWGESGLSGTPEEGGSPAGPGGAAAAPFPGAQRTRRAQLPFPPEAAWPPEPPLLPRTGGGGEGGRACAPSHRLLHPRRAPLSLRPPSSPAAFFLPPRPDCSLVGNPA